MLHIDSLDILDDLDDQQVANLFRAIKAYKNGESLELDTITKMVFLPFKNQFARDDEKYQHTCDLRALAGSKGGKAKVANASKSKQKVANVTNLADSVSKSDNESDSDNDSKSNLKDSLSDKSDDAVFVLEYMNGVLNTKYKTSTKSHIENINARLSEGHTKDDLKKVIDFKKIEWANDPRMAGYLRPQTLFQTGKFQGYLTAANSTRVQSGHDLSNKKYISGDL